MDDLEQQEKEKNELNELYLKFLNEKKQFQEEMKLLNQKVLQERKRLKEDELFFSKKMEILKGGFAQLEQDKLNLAREKKFFEMEKEDFLYVNQKSTGGIELFFTGVNNPLALKKRYRDLIKIFHPDNLCGDTELLQRINKEYESLLDTIGWQKKA